MESIFVNKSAFLLQAAGALSEDCEAYAVVGSKVLCDSSKVKEAAAKLSSEETSTLYAGDHKRCLQHCSADRSSVVLVYGELGSEKLSPFLSADMGAYTVLRHYVKVGCFCEYIYL